MTPRAVFSLTLNVIYYNFSVDNVTQDRKDAALMNLTPTNPMMVITVRAVSEGPQFSPSQREARATAVVGAMFAMLPMNALQVMLAAQIVVHHFAVMDAYTELTTMDASGAEAARLRSAAAMSTRCMIGLRRELRLAKQEATEFIEAVAAARTDQAANGGAGAPEAEAPQPAEPRSEAPDAASFKSMVADIRSKLHESHAETRAMEAGRRKVPERDISTAVPPRPVGMGGQPHPAGLFQAALD